MKTQCLQTNEMQHCLGKESALGEGRGVERVVLIKSLFSEIERMRLGHRVAKFS
jgi:hypothetical protein